MFEDLCESHLLKWLQIQRQTVLIETAPVSKPEDHLSFLYLPLCLLFQAPVYTKYVALSMMNKRKAR